MAPHRAWEKRGSGRLTHVGNRELDSMMGTGLKQKGKPIFLVCSGWGALGKAVAAVKPRGFLWFGDPLNSWDGRGARGTLMCVWGGGGTCV